MLIYEMAKIVIITIEINHSYINKRAIKNALVSNCMYKYIFFGDKSSFSTSNFEE